MVQVKEEVVDLEYEEAEQWREQEEEDDALMVARKIKQEFEENSPSPVPPPTQTIREHHHQAEIERPSAPIVFDHFICMRIGLNSRNNVQRLMALLTAHEFVDLTVLPGPSMMAPALPPMISLGVPRLPSQPPSRLISACHQEASTSNGSPLDILSLEARHRLLPQFPHLKVKRNMVKKLVPKPFIRPTPSADCGIIPINMQCRKCDEILPKGSHGSSALNHVQKNHLKMAAFQCRICKHYRTTQERIQSHVTTVHKAKSTKFDSSLAGPLSAEDMKKMEEMITYCFPKLKMELQVTDRLIAKTMEVDLAGSSK
ncbi:hypothetical protein CAEBREN_09389 [Caenorhabditis brenneri]|uniref:Uncharacterized protein n=1 Tax=Caenorhabditis brenneri TaxID=135651 RepID=G0MHD2_CAEBE|nr:hypothetical protein CAEBREN_09389 [Caenorhabditis brenneri]